jgi:hypothetical protein
MRQPQRGFALIAAIVLVVVLAALAGFVATMVGGQTASQQLERTTIMVEAAAQTGVEWGRNRRTAGALNCAASPTFTLSSTNLNNIQIVVSCDATNKIRSTASFGVVNSPDFVERIITEP